MDLNTEKEEILNSSGDILVTANPGTGKTLFLSHKYARLIEEGVPADEILCLTFTKKAKREMEERIIHLIEDKNLPAAPTDINVHTFHSYALECLHEDEVISSDLLRYAIFEYIQEEEVFHYSDSYLLNQIVPKIENLIRYLKTFGVLPSQIDVEEIKSQAEWPDNSDQKDRFLSEFVRMFQHYETVKEGRGIDYSDLLIHYLQLEDHLVYEYVLVDELQDVNEMEADMALCSANHFVAVGDAKQAIFGFQGGSTLNFQKFTSGKQYVLTENFRSTDEILKYASAYFVQHSEQQEFEEELNDLRSATGKKGERPKIVSVDRDNRVNIACNIARKLIQQDTNVAIVARTNSQVQKISTELKERGLDHASTYVSASKQAKDSIITFLKSLLSKNIDTIKSGMFTPFFPIGLQDAFELAESRDTELSDIYESAPEFQEIREGVNSIEDLQTIFEERIIPISLGYGEEYFLAALTIQESLVEALRVLDQKTLDQFINYLQACDLKEQNTAREKQINVTTVHKAKGKEYDQVIYLPSSPSGRNQFMDEVIETILSSKGIDVREELQKEELRIDFVACTRAKEGLFVLSDEANKYKNEHADIVQPESIDMQEEKHVELKRRAYSLFVHERYQQAKKELESQEQWLRDYIQRHFENKEHLSYSDLTKYPYRYLKNTIFSIVEPSPALELGRDVHDIAESLSKGKEVEVPDQLVPYARNIDEQLEQIREEYPDVLSTEEKYSIPLSNIIEQGDGMTFDARIDAIFQNGDQYLIVDWKTSNRTTNGSKYRRQLELYRRVFSAVEEVPLEQVRVGIGYVGLQKRVSDGQIRGKFDRKQPSERSFNTVKKRLDRFLSWREDVDRFFSELQNAREDNHLVRCTIEQFKKEVQSHDRG